VINTAAIKARFDALEPRLDEKGRRLFAANEARAAGRGGIAAVSQVTGIARSTIGRGLKDLLSGTVLRRKRVRRRAICRRSWPSRASSQARSSSAAC
jgi:hypothetical protein